MNRQKRILEEHNRLYNGACYFCGRPNSADTIDHVPPKACFPDGYAPEDFESPACKTCNGDSDVKKQDQIFGFYSILLDFNESTMRQKEAARKLMKLRQGIANNYPDALPDITKAYPLNRMGSIITPQTVAFLMPTPDALQHATEMVGKKLTHALYFREVRKMLTRDHQFWIHSYQPQQGKYQALTSYLVNLLPEQTIGQRPNIKKYGDRFQYLSGNKAHEDFFMFAAQFGHGIILCGVVCGSGCAKPSDGPLSSSPWFRGACGPGAILR
jgi:hypothetical protein